MLSSSSPTCIWHCSKTRVSRNIPLSFTRLLPYIVELRAKAGDTPVGEIETCFNALYGMLMLRLQGKEITPDTLDAVAQISKFLALLARDYNLDREDKLFKDEE